MTKDTKAKDREALARLLDVYGADRTRWPARERLRFAGYIAEDEEARRLVAESAALDALLDRAPRMSDAREHALKERIIAAALRSGETKLAIVTSQQPEGNPSRLAAWMRRAGEASTRVGLRGRQWPAAGVLAASLIAGVLLGSSGTLDTAVQQVADAAGVSATAETSQLALGDEIVAVVDEDLL